MLKDIQLGGVASADHSYIHQTNLEVVDVSDPGARIEVPRGGARARRMVDNYPVPIGGSVSHQDPFSRPAGGRALRLPSPHPRA